jgi:GNAT superfamily N-acetyltransferase
MPSYAWALQKMRGYLFPFGIFYLLFSKFFNKKITLYLIGIHPDFQKRGVTAIIFNSFIQTLKNKGIEICRRTPELTENISIDKIWGNFSPELIKTRSTFKKKLSKN